MKKSTFLIVAMMIMILRISAQNLVIWDSVAHYLPHDTTLIKSGPLDSEKEMCKYLAVKNVSTAPIAVCVKKVIIDTVPGSKNYLCWVRCYSDRIYAPTDTVLLPPQKTDFYHFAGHYRPMEKNGSSTVRYVFYDRYNHNDSASVKITFSPTNVGIPDQGEIKNTIIATPNPANDEVNFSYSLSQGSSGKITIFQVTGTVISETPVQTTHGVLNINTQDLRDGLYFYYLVVDGKVCSAKKLVVRHQ